MKPMTIALFSTLTLSTVAFAETMPGEALLLSKLSPDARSARRWAEMQQVISSRARHGRAVNLDPASLILDILFSIEDTAHSVAAA